MDARFRVAGIGRLPFELVAKLAGLAEAKLSSSPRSLVQSVNAGKGGGMFSFDTGVCDAVLCGQNN